MSTQSGGTGGDQAVVPPTTTGTIGGMEAWSDIMDADSRTKVQQEQSQVGVPPAMAMGGDRSGKGAANTSLCHGQLYWVEPWLLGSWSQQECVGGGVREGYQGKFFSK